MVSLQSRQERFEVISMKVKTILAFNAADLDRQITELFKDGWIIRWETFQMEALNDKFYFAVMLSKHEGERT